MRQSFESFLKKINTDSFSYVPVNINMNGESKENADDDKSPLLDRDEETVDLNEAITNYYNYIGSFPQIGVELPKFSDLDLQVFGNKNFNTFSFPTRKSAPTFSEKITIQKRNTDVTKEQLLSIAELFKQKGIPVRITSLERPGAKTASGHTSWHATGQAMDIVPESGDFTALLSLLESDPEVRGAMAKIGVGYIDETTAEMMARTHATGKHIHIGPDNLAIQFFNKV